MNINKNYKHRMITCCGKYRHDGMFCAMMMRQDAPRWRSDIDPDAMQKCVFLKAMIMADGIKHNM